jgi:hypothetical protein
MPMDLQRSSHDSTYVAKAELEVRASAGRHANKHPSNRRVGDDPNIKRQTSESHRRSTIPHRPRHSPIEEPARADISHRSRRRSNEFRADETQEPRRPTSNQRSGPSPGEGRHGARMERRSSYGSAQQNSNRHRENGLGDPMPSPNYRSGSGHGDLAFPSQRQERRRSLGGSGGNRNNVSPLEQSSARRHQQPNSHRENGRSVPFSSRVNDASKGQQRRRSLGCDAGPRKSLIRKGISPESVAGFLCTGIEQRREEVPRQKGCEGSGKDRLVGSVLAFEQPRDRTPPPRRTSLSGSYGAFGNADERLLQRYGSSNNQYEVNRAVRNDAAETARLLASERHTILEGKHLSKHRGSL